MALTNWKPAEDVDSYDSDRESSAGWKKDWVKISSEFAQNRRVWSASVRDVAISISDAGLTRQEEKKKRNMGHTKVLNQAWTDNFIPFVVISEPQATAVGIRKPF